MTEELRIETTAHFDRPTLSAEQIEVLEKIISLTYDTDKLMYCRDERGRYEAGTCRFVDTYGAAASVHVYLSGFKYDIDSVDRYIIMFTMISNSFENADSKIKELKRVAKTILNELGL